MWSRLGKTLEVSSSKLVPPCLYLSLIRRGCIETGIKLYMYPGWKCPVIMYKALRVRIILVLSATSWVFYMDSLGLLLQGKVSGR